jgi:hypothetical protein
LPLTVVDLGKGNLELCLKDLDNGAEGEKPQEYSMSASDEGLGGGFVHVQLFGDKRGWDGKAGWSNSRRDESGAFVSVGSGIAEKLRGSVRNSAFSSKGYCR